MFFYIERTSNGASGGRLRQPDEKWKKADWNFENDLPDQKRGGRIQKSV